MTDFPSLLARLESADGPGREIDALLMVAIEPPTGDAFWQWRGLQPKGTQDRAEADLQADYAREHAPAYTASLDAAIALCRRALPGWEVLLSNEGDVHWVASIGPRGTFTSCEAVTPAPALALCIATVKALIVAQQERTPHD